jgi:hypothetical protein
MIDPCRARPDHEVDPANLNQTRQEMNKKNTEVMK